MTENGLNGNTKLVWIVLLIALGTGGVGAYNSADVEGKFQSWLDKQDEVLQREMRLLIDPIRERLTGQIQDNKELVNELRTRINELEQKVAVLEERTKP